MDINKIISNAHEGMCAPILDNAIEIMHRNVESLALQRRTIELLGIPEHLDRYDTEITKKIDEETARFANMDMADLMRYMRRQILKLDERLDELTK